MITFGTRDELSRGLTGVRLTEAQTAVAEMIEGLAPIRLDLLRTEIARRFGYQRTSARLLATIDALISQEQLFTEPAGTVFCWPLDVTPEEWTGIPRRGTVTSVLEVPLVELANLLDRLPARLKKADDPTELYRRGLHRLGLTRLTAATRRRFEEARELLDSRTGSARPATPEKEIIPDEDAPGIRYKQWKVSSVDSLAPIIPEDKRRGIYVLDFANGDRYVGMATDVVSRFSTHVHGSSHHEGWDDIVMVSFRHLSEGDLRVEEQAEIDRQVSQQTPLRNRTGVLNSVSTSPMDDVVSIDEQEHWSLGDIGASSSDFDALVLPDSPRTSKLRKTTSSAIYNAVLDDLSFAIEHLIPAALETEGQYWTLSDCPSTAGGRFATLNTGVLEFLVFPKQAVAGQPGLNEPKTFEPGAQLGFFNVVASPQDLETYDPEATYFNAGPGQPPIVFYLAEYSVTPVIHTVYQVGQLKSVISHYPGFLEETREFTLALMRYRRSGLFQRWHSRELTDEVYRRIKGKS